MKRGRGGKETLADKPLDFVLFMARGFENVCEIVSY